MILVTPFLNLSTNPHAQERVKAEVEVPKHRGMSCQVGMKWKLTKSQDPSNTDPGSPLSEQVVLGLLAPTILQMHIL